MTEEIINGVKTIWHSNKEETLQRMSNLLFKLLYENWLEEQRNKESKREEENNSG